MNASTKFAALLFCIIAQSSTTVLAQKPRFETHAYRTDLLIQVELDVRMPQEERKFRVAYDELREKQVKGEITHRERVTLSLRRAGFDIPEPCWANLSPFDSMLYISATPKVLAEIERKLRLKPQLPHPAPLVK